MAFWTVRFSKEAYKGYRKVQKNYRNKIDKILQLLIAKEKIDIKPVKGEKAVYRLRIGKYRMLIKKYEQQQVILVVRIAPRGDVYKK